jgi:hypothetical protein
MPTWSRSRSLHIDTMYPAKWLNAPKNARVSLRNTIVGAVTVEAAAKR